MRGSSHVVIGIATGGAIVHFGSYSSSDSIAIITTCAIASLVPDLDTNGKLANKVTIPVKLVHTLFSIFGLLLMGYSYFQGTGFEQWIGMGLGASLLVLPRFFIKTNTMLILTGIIVLLIGMSLVELWLIGMGIYIVIAAFLPHRGLTHSIIGLFYFAWIMFHFERSLLLEGVMVAGIAGYASHLIADLRLLPFNRKGVKLFQPFLQKEW